jgi:DNA-binding transcriptional ArsR family regulator
MAYQKVLDALGSPTRCLILERLRNGPTTVGKIAADIPVTRPAVSQHLNVLRKAGLVREWVIGAKHIYQLDQGGLEDLRAWLDRFSGEEPSAAKTAGKGRALLRRTKRGRRDV